MLLAELQILQACLLYVCWLSLGQAVGYMRALLVDVLRLLVGIALILACFGEILSVST